MKNLVVGTGGYVIQADSFASSLFVQSFKRILEKDEKEQIDMNFNATVEIKARFLFVAMRNKVIYTSFSTSLIGLALL